MFVVLINSSLDILVVLIGRHWTFPVWICSSLNSLCFSCLSFDVLFGRRMFFVFFSDSLDILCLILAPFQFLHVGH